MTTYRHAPEIKQLADQLIREVEQHADLKDAEIRYVWRDKAARSKGRVTLAKARRVSGLAAFLAQSDLADTWESNTPLFIVEVAEDTWPKLDEAQRKALVDHELCHLRVDYDDAGESVLSIRGHDLEEFGCIVQRHGLWKADVATFGGHVAEQLALAVEQSEEFLRDIAEREDPEAEA